MSTTQSNTDQPVDRTAKGAIVPALQPVLSERYALSAGQMLFVVPFVLLFVYVSYVPIAGTVWSNIAAGKQMLSDRALPTEVSGMPLAAGLESFRLAWLSDVIFATAHNMAGPAGVSGLATILIVATVLLWSTLLKWFTLSRRGLLCSISLMVLAWWQLLDEPGAFHLGSLCLAVFCWMLFRPRSELIHPTSVGITWKQWFAVTALMVVWANMGPSFLFGLATLLAIALGNAIDLYRQRGSTSLLSDQRLQRSFYLFELAAAATLINPLGPRLWTSLFQLRHNPFVAAFGYSGPLQLASYSGLLLAITLIALMVAIRKAEAVGGATIVMAVGGTAVVALNAQLLVWVVPLMTIVAVRLHHDNLPVARLAPEMEPQAQTVQQHRPLQFAWSLICLLVIWCGFALSPLSDPLLASTQRPKDAWLSTETPTPVTENLKQHSVSGMVWSPAEWGDWIAYEGNPGTSVFTTSRFDLLPNHAKRDYVKILKGQDNWQRAVDRYGIKTLVINKRTQSTLAREARMSADWLTRFENPMALVLTRREVR